MKLTREHIINGWLQKYHGITVEELIKNEPELCKTPDWFKKYAVTQEQHDEWYEWAIDQLSKNLRRSKKLTKRLFVIDYLITAPSVK